MLTICLDCNCARELNKYGRCNTCDSNSIVIPGAVEVVSKLIKHANAEEEIRKRSKIINFPTNHAPNTNLDVQKKGGGIA
jgi:hypothetical protein